MAANRSLRVCLCIEDLDTCDIVVNQIANGSVFGFNQPFYLMLQGTDLHQLEDLRMEVQDCAFPLLRGVSIHTTFEEAFHTPDIILVLLSHRSCGYTESPTEQFQELYSLVNYIIMLSELLSSLPLNTTKILVVGDLALTAAAILSKKLHWLTATQLLAVDGQQKKRLHIKMPKQAASTRHYSKVNNICETVRQWWIGVKDTLASSLHLGVKFFNTKSTPGPANSGYFFSAPVNLTGPVTFHTCSDLHLDPQHTAEVKASSDRAFKLMEEMEGQCNKINNDDSSSWIAHL